MSKAEQRDAFYRWTETLDLPKNYCRLTLQSYSLLNAAEAEENKFFEVAKSTALSYLNDEDFAIEAGVAKACA